MSYIVMRGADSTEAAVKVVRRAAVLRRDLFYMNSLVTESRVISYIIPSPASVEYRQQHGELPPTGLEHLHPLRVSGRHLMGRIRLRRRN